METVIRPHVENFIRWSADKPEVIVLTADLTNSCEVGKWRDTYPDRYFSMDIELLRDFNVTIRYSFNFD